MEIFLIPETWVALLTLTLLEIVLGIDNIIFISIVSNKLPAEQQGKSRFIGLSLALIMRIGLLAGITWIIGLTEPLFVIKALDHPVSYRDIILLLGGLFLIFKSTLEIGHKMEGVGMVQEAVKKSKFTAVVLQIILLDIIFSFDLILTADCSRLSAPPARDITKPTADQDIAGSTKTLVSSKETSKPA